jgi:ubiquinone/menaquinone biosynthesis C-methylase UbiE
MNNKQFTSEEIAAFWEKNPVYNDFIRPTGDLRKFFEVYDAHRFRDVQYILELLDSIDFKGKEVLEIGTGQGADAQQIIKRGGVYTGVDITEESIKRLTTRFKLFGLPYKGLHVMNAEHLTFPNESFDIVYSIGVLLVSPRIEMIVAHVHRVLRKGGKAVIMLYYKDSANYHISIKIIRRLGIFLLYIPFVDRLVSKLTGEPLDRLNKHKANLKAQGLSYLKMENFIHRSTDGPDNPYTSVWTKAECTKLFSNFSMIRYNVRYLNERHFPIIRHLIPNWLKSKIEHKWGWNLLITVTK